MTKQRLLLLDGHSVAFRAFFALPAENFQTDTGQYTNAIFGFTSMLVRMLEEIQPDFVAVAFDVSRTSFRTRKYKDYKAGRAKTPEEFKNQIPLIKEVLDAIGVRWFEKEDYEADDIVATLARMGRENGLQVLISSGDRDAFQLITDSVTVLYPGKSMSDLRRMTPEAVEEKYGLPPQRYPHLAALVGESADHLPGVPGVGPKTAAGWINKYDGLEGVLANADKIGGKRGQALREHVEDVRRNRELNQLVDDLDLHIELSELKLSPANTEEIARLFDSLEFNRLRLRVLEAINASGGSAAREAEVVAPTQMQISTPSELKGGVGAWLAELNEREPVGIAVRGSMRPGMGEAEEISLYQSGRALYLEPVDLNEEDARALAQWLESPTAPLVASDGKALAHALKGAGFALGRLASDVQLAAYLCKPDSRSYETSLLVDLYLNREGAETTSGQGTLPLPGQGDTLAKVARDIADLHLPLKGQLEQRNARELMEQMELPVQRLLAQMEDAGIAVDKGELSTQYESLSAEVEQLANDAYTAIGHEVNLSSPKQLQVVLFDELKMPKTRKTKTGYTTNAEALAELFAKTQHPFLEALLAHRDRIKLRQTVEGLRKAIQDDGRIHTTFQQTVAATGRLSSTDPNLQNVPAHTQMGMAIRGAFVPGEEYDSLLTADYSQIEMRLMAHMSGDEALLEAFAEGEDIHATMAAMVFGVSQDAVTHSQRSQVKATSYGLAYGLSAYGLSRQLGIPVPEATKLRDRYFERFGGIHDYLESLVRAARKDGYTQTIMGRRRYLPDLTSSNRQRREMAERAALNAPIQGSAADIIKLAMLKVHTALAAEKLCSRVLLQVHDELVVEVAAGEGDTVAELIRQAMADPIKLDVALEVSEGRGKNWRDAAH
ncbi:DNA-directed DNA polymerase [Winkia neuii]|uniref:DNA polymerase I n=1 Tax=Winkia neuii TaxID=33007 RepID=UPI0007642A9F|nr:DNA polymerase I [Winkia neuii]KWZ72174.1 DNA-directed DNA polymerase [Winkia neuii]